MRTGLVPDPCTPRRGPCPPRRRTTWEANAVLVGQAAGLPEWPSLRLDRRRDGRGRVARKAAAIGQVLVVDPCPYTWVDDCLDAAGRLPPNLARLGLAHLLIRPSLLVGLTDDHIHQLVDFARLTGSEQGQNRQR